MKGSSMHDTVVIGVGPAGISAGIYTARANLKTLIIGKFSESRLSTKHKIYNYYGFVNGIQANKLLNDGIKQAKKLGVEVKEGEIVNIKKIKNGFEVKTSENKKYKTKTVIIASGSKIEKLGIKNEKELANRGIHYCSLCDGPLYSGKKIAVVGNGNHAAEEAIELRTYTKDITIISHEKKFAISKELMPELKKRGIRMINDTITEFYGKNKIEKIIMKKGNIKCEAAFIANGKTSSISLAKKLGLEIKDNNLITNEGETNIKGIFAAGETTGANKQVAICVGEGCKAAIKAIKYIRGKETYVDYSNK